jgi:hypothetical protein
MEVVLEEMGAPVLQKVAEGLGVMLEMVGGKHKLEPVVVGAVAVKDTLLQITAAVGVVAVLVC